MATDIVLFRTNERLDKIIIQNESLVESSKHIKRIADILEHNVIPERTWLGRIANKYCTCHVLSMKDKIPLWDIRMHEKECGFVKLAEVE